VFYTPPLSRGLLGGVMRRSLLSAGVIPSAAVQRVNLSLNWTPGLYRYMINSLKEWVEISLDVSG